MITAVTGASGHLGAHVVRALLAEGRQVRAISLHPRAAARGLRGLDVEHVQADVRDAPAVARALRGAEVVYHMAAVISLHARDESLMRAVNVTGTGNVVDACLKGGVRRLLHVSSIHAFAPDKTEAIVDETRGPARDPRVPAYDRSKALGNDEVRRGAEAGLSTVTVHPTGILGPLDHAPSHLGRTILWACRGWMPVATPGGFNWVDARDVTAGMLAAERQGKRPRYLLGGHWAPTLDLFRMATAAVGRRPPRVAAPFGLLRAVAKVADAMASVTPARLPISAAALHALETHRNISCAAAAEDLGYAPRPLETTIADTIAWYREAGMLGR